LTGILSFAQSPAKLAAINKKVVGKWISTDGKSFIEFFPDQSCEVGSLGRDGKWQTFKNVLGAWQVGDSFRCGSGALDLKGPNTMTRDYGMGGTPEAFHRRHSLKSKKQ
jgi:hypothetical protein